MQTKRCPKCGQTKDLDHFSFRGSGKWCSYCKDCQREYCRSHYKKNKVAHIRRRAQNQKAARERLSAVIRQYKESKSCVDCGKQHPYYVMDFDHRDRANKEFQIGDAASLGKTLRQVRDEIAKCDLVCANCHRYRTFKNYGM